MLGVLVFLFGSVNVITFIFKQNINDITLTGQEVFLVLKVKGCMCKLGGQYDWWCVLVNRIGGVYFNGIFPGQEYHSMDAVVSIVYAMHA